MCTINKHDKPTKVNLHVGKLSLLRFYIIIILIVMCICFCIYK